MAYWEWGDAANPHRAGVRARPVAPGARLRHAGAALCPADYRVVCPDVVGAAAATGWPTRWATRSRPTSPTCWRCWRSWTRQAPGLGGHQHGRADRLGLASRTCPAGAGASAGAQRRGAGDRVGGRCSASAVPGPAGAFRFGAAGCRCDVGHVHQLWPAHARAVAGAVAGHGAPSPMAASRCTTTRPLPCPFRTGDARNRRSRARRRCGSSTTRCLPRRCCCAARCPTCCRGDRPGHDGAAPRPGSWSLKAWAMRPR
jgi:hypothetical protein